MVVEDGVVLNLHGRRMIQSDVDVVDESNIVDVLRDAIPDFSMNAAEEKYLYNVYKNIMNIRFKTKDTRPEINHIVAEARAHQIVDFKTAYVGGDPIVLTSRSMDTVASDEIVRINDMLVYENRDAVNKQVLDWMHITGHGYKMCLPDKDDDATPFEICSLEPMQTAVIYSSMYHHKPLAAFYKITKRIEDVPTDVYTVYTPTQFIRVKNALEVIEVEEHALGMIPIVEYPLSDARLGTFEPVLDLLDAINYLDSDRMDGVTSFINSLCVLYNAQLPEGQDGNTIREQGLICLKSVGDNKADIKILSEQLDQTSTQTLKDDLYNAVLQIVGMPNQSSGNTSDSSNNGAVLLKNGYQLAEARAKDTELMFTRSEREIMKLVLKICRETGVLDLDVSDIDVTFTRKQYSDIVSKSTVFATLVNSGMCAPIDAWEISGLSSDPEACCKRGMEWRYINDGTDENADGSAEKTVPVG